MVHLKCINYVTKGLLAHMRTLNTGYMTPYDPKKLNSDNITMKSVWRKFNKVKYIYVLLHLKNKFLILN